LNIEKSYQFYRMMKTSNVKGEPSLDNRAGGPTIDEEAISKEKQEEMRKTGFTGKNKFKQHQGWQDFDGKSSGTYSSAQQSVQSSILSQSTSQMKGNSKLLGKGKQGKKGKKGTKQNEEPVNKLQQIEEEQENEGEKNQARGQGGDGNKKSPRSEDSPQNVNEEQVPRRVFEIDELAEEIIDLSAGPSMACMTQTEGDCTKPVDLDAAIQNQAIKSQRVEEVIDDGDMEFEEEPKEEGNSQQEPKVKKRY